MVSRLRVLLMCLLMLALPLQGYAAVTMAGCGPDHHPRPVATAADPAAAQTHAHDHAAALADADGASARAGDHGSAVQHLDAVSKSKCSSCAACCVGAALPAAAFVFTASAPAGVPTSPLATGQLGFVTDGPDRPPRHRLA